MSTHAFFKSLVFTDVLHKTEWGYHHLCCAVLNHAGISASATPWTMACQAPLSMGILQATHWSGFPCCPPGDRPNPEIEPRSPACRWILYHLSHQGSPGILEWVTYPFSRGSSTLRNRTQVSCIAGRFFTRWASREALWLSTVMQLSSK